MVRWFAGMMSDENHEPEGRAFPEAASPSALLAPVIGLLKGLTDPVNGMLMGQTAENLAWRFGINRRQMDEFSSAQPPAGDGGAQGGCISQRSCRWSMAAAKSTPKTMACARIRAPMAWPSCARYSINPMAT
jgi:hypothetical protein